MQYKKKNTETKNRRKKVLEVQLLEVKTEPS